MSREMTNSEAISNLNHIYSIVSPDIQRSLDLAIKALEERPQGDLISREVLKKSFAEYGEKAKFTQGFCQQLIDNAPTVDKGYDFGYADGHGEGYELGKNSRPQGELNADESRLIGEAVDYLLGADLVEENGWSENDIKVLQSLHERYYDEDSEEEE